MSIAYVKFSFGLVDRNENDRDGYAITLHFIERYTGLKPVYIETLTLDILTVDASATDSVHHLMKKLSQKWTVESKL